jgi:hypothetical protein
MSGHSAKSGQLLYYRCTNALKRDPNDCPGHWIPKATIEGFIIDKIRNYVLTEENLLELVHLTGEEIGSELAGTREHLRSLEEQVRDIDIRLEHLYDALEKGSFTPEELAPRIRKWKARREELEIKKQNVEMEVQSMVFEMPDIKLVKSYVEDLKTVLGSATIIEQRAFLKSFVKDIQVGTDLVTIHYTVPMAPKNSDEERVGVLLFMQHGRPNVTIRHPPVSGNPSVFSKSRFRPHFIFTVLRSSEG